MNNKLSLFALIGLVVGTMVGGGVYNLPSDLAKASYSGAVIAAWIITAVGMISLALVFQNLASTKPELDGGIYSYAREGFGEYIGFNAAWGYWISGIFGNIALFLLLFSSIGYFLPAFDGGNNLLSIICASILLWGVHILIVMGFQTAALVNFIATIGKIIPIIIFIFFVAISFKIDIFTYRFWGSFEFSLPVFVSQVKDSMHVTLWVFIGVEGAVILSGRAKRREDIGKATVLGLLATLVLYLLISLLSFGVVPAEELALLKTPSTAYVLELIIGKAGAVIINAGLIVSLLGAIIGWTLLVVEIPYVASKDRVFPKKFQLIDKNNVPIGSLWVSNIITQLILVITFFSSSTYELLYSLATTSILLPYMLSAMFQVKLLKEETYRNSINHYKTIYVTAIIASLYSLWLVFAAGLNYLLLVTIVYAMGIILYIYSRREVKGTIFTSFEWWLAFMFLLFAMLASVSLVFGLIEF